MLCERLKLVEKSASASFLAACGEVGRLITGLGNAVSRGSAEA
jgi:hypothetical protein